MRTLTQDQLIARALDMEEGNIVEHRNYLSNEDEKRKRAHVVRPVVQGPLLRWVSKRESITVTSDSMRVLPECAQPDGHTYEPQIPIATTSNAVSASSTGKFYIDFA